MNPSSTSQSIEFTIRKHFYYLIPLTVLAGSAIFIYVFYGSGGKEIFTAAILPALIIMVFLFAWPIIQFFKLNAIQRNDTGWQIKYPILKKNIFIKNDSIEYIHLIKDVKEGKLQADNKICIKLMGEKLIIIRAYKINDFNAMAKLLAEDFPTLFEVKNNN